MEGTSARPEWWNENQEIRDRYSLPEYTAPRFADDTYTYEVVSRLESDYDCEIRFIGVNTRYAEDWEVRIDDEYLMEVSRKFDGNGNMIYGIESDEFRAACERSLDTN
ncbi:hypothetical protein [Natrinema caseinilyticum]|uniref:hypothetical protein n=1 Tax=Natrinema caseinilyticum TaxID=2961570 RepID=UPI0020C278AE|nr:hypothetical protein [Natrinema caseinilyticum]